eukprot:2832335-Rhodomonas_salina.3
MSSAKPPERHSLAWDAGPDIVHGVLPLAVEPGGRAARVGPHVREVEPIADLQLRQPRAGHHHVDAVAGRAEQLGRHRELAPLLAVEHVRAQLRVVEDDTVEGAVGAVADVERNLRRLAVLVHRADVHLRRRVLVLFGLRVRRVVLVLLRLLVLVRPRPERLDVRRVHELARTQLPLRNHRHSICVARTHHVPPRLCNHLHTLRLWKVLLDRRRDGHRNVRKGEGSRVRPWPTAPQVQKVRRESVGLRGLESVASGGHRVSERLDFSASRADVEGDADNVEAEVNAAAQ